MRVAAGQFAVTPVWRTNAQTCVAMMQQAEQEGAALLVLPEALLARDDNDPDLSVGPAAGWRIFAAAVGREQA